MEKDDIYWMTQALEIAKESLKDNEVPVGALIIGPEGLISKSSNTREKDQTPLGHAELQALHHASQVRKSWRLEDCTLYVTLEPCVMCAGAIQQSRIKRVVYAAKDPKGGAVDSLYKILTNPQLNHKCEIKSGVLEANSSELLTSFFQDRRNQKRAEKDKRIYRERASVVVFHNNKVLGFHAVDPTSQKEYFFLPGGGIEAHETPALAAQRECLEETGYEIEIDPSSEFIREYPFNWDGKTYFCKTYFYIGSLKDPTSLPRNIEDASYNKGPSWRDAKASQELFSYTPDILSAVQKMFKRYQKNLATAKNQKIN